LGKCSGKGRGYVGHWRSISLLVRKTLEEGERVDL
jgi:hypothetical protein